jgi:hypothetical protein
MVEEVNSCMIYLILCKNLCKCHIVPPSHHNNKGIKKSATQTCKKNPLSHRASYFLLHEDSFLTTIYIKNNLQIFI